jgi:hypothetical protein
MCRRLRIGEDGHRHPTQEIERVLGTSFEGFGLEVWHAMIGGGCEEAPGTL